MYTAIDLFAGIGGIRLGFEQAFGTDLKTVFYCEVDKDARKTYRANFRTSVQSFCDVRNVNIAKIPAFDICLAGFPCQSFSIAGKHKALDDPRGTLFMEIIRICDLHRPQIIFCENVKNLISIEKGRIFKIITGEFEKIGYTVKYRVLNSKNFGVPQNRERVFIVCFRNNIGCSGFEFPEGKECTETIGDILDSAPVDPDYYISEHYYKWGKQYTERQLAEQGKDNSYCMRIKNPTDISVCLTTCPRIRNLFLDNRQGSISKNSGYGRYPTIRESARLQGFPESFIFPVSRGAAYKQLGNSVTVPVIRAIAERIKETLDCNRHLCRSQIEKDIDVPCNMSVLPTSSENPNN